MREHRCVGRGGSHALRAEGSGGIRDQRHVIAELHAEASRGLNAAIGDEPNQDDLLDVVLLEKRIEVSIGKPL